MTPGANAAALLSDDNLFDPAIPSTNATVAAQFLGELYRDVDGDDWLQLVHVGPNGGLITEWFSPDQTVAMAQRATTLPGSGVWVSVATRRERLGDGKRGSESDCAHVVAFVADLDVAGPGHAEVAGRLPLIATVADARALLAGFALPPTVIVNTGGGLQAWWVLNEPATIADARPVTGRWGATWPEIGRLRDLHIDNVGDVARMMRLPGTLNRKRDRPAPAEVTVVHADWSRRYGLDDIDQATIEPEHRERPRSTERRATPVDSPIGWYNQTHDIDDELRAHGCVWSHDSRHDPQSHWFAPHHTEDRDRTGVTVYDNTDAVIWSATFAAQLGVKERASLDAFSLYRIRAHSGNDHEAVRAAGAMMRNTERSNTDHGHHDGPPANVDPETGEIIDDGSTSSGLIPSNGLPESFWTARPVFTHIRQAAHSRMLSAFAVLGCVLARVAALTPPSYKLPPTVGAPSTLAVYIAVTGTPGSGKSTAKSEAKQLLPCDDERIVDDLALGSGEGLIDSFFTTVDEMVDGKRVRQKRQTKHGAFFYLDEGQALLELGTRKGATLLPVLRTAWTGQTSGNANASTETKRHIGEGRYVIGLVVAFQPAMAAGLLADGDGGTPQRFEWCSTIDPTVPAVRPPWPGPLNWTAPHHGPTAASTSNSRSPSTPPSKPRSATHDYDASKA